MGNATPRKQQDLMGSATVDLGFAGLDTRKVVMLSEALATNTVVKKLCLGWNDIGDIGAEKLAVALEKNKTLTELNLTENGIGEKGAECLAKALACNETLRVLDLMSNRIGDKGAGYLASSLGKNKTLQELRLYDTGIEYAGASRLMNAAEKNETLLVLDIRWNDISDRRLVAKMEQSFAKNRGVAARRRDAPLAQRGDLELYILTMREKISSTGDFGGFVSEEERDSLRKDLGEAEIWLRDNQQATLDEYRGKLDALKSICDVVAVRYQDSLMRQQMTTAIYSTIANYRATVENVSSEDRGGEIDEAKKAKILNACSELEQWITDMKQAQEHLPNYEHPVLRCQDMVDRNLELANMVAELLEDSHGGFAEALKEVAASSARGPASARGQAAGPTMGGNERKSQLLSYVAQLQQRIAINGEFGAYVSEAERERLHTHLIGASIWASQSTNVPTVHYIEKLQELRSVGDVIEWRCDEDSMRNDWIAAVSSTIQNCRNAATNPGDKYEKVTGDKLEKIVSSCKELEDWLHTMEKAQKALAKYERPVLLCADMERRNLELARSVGEMLEECRGPQTTNGQTSAFSKPQTTQQSSAGYNYAPPKRQMPAAPAEDCTVEDDGAAGGLAAMRGTGHTPRRHTPCHTPRDGLRAQDGVSTPPRPPALGPHPELLGVTVSTPRSRGRLRNANTPGSGKAVTEDERMMELDALDAACGTVVDEDEAPMAGRMMA